MPQSVPTPEFTPGDDENIVEQLFELIHRIRRHPWVVFTVVLLALAGALIHTFRQPIFYRSEVALLVDSRPPRVLDVSTTEVIPEEQMADRERFLNSQIRILTSQSISERVEHKLGMPKGSLIGVVQGTADKNSYVLTLAVSDLDGEKAARLVKAFADVFMESSLLERTGVASETSRFLENETASQRRALEEDERALYDFHRRNELPASSFDESHKIASSTLGTLHEQEAAARAKLIRLRAQVDEVRAAKGNPSLQRLLLQRGETEESMQSPTLARHNALLEQKQQLEARYGAKHPKVIESGTALEAVDDILGRDLEVELKALEAKLRASEKEQAQLRSAIAGEVRRAVDLRQKEVEYNRLRRKFDEDSDAYTSLAKRQRETALQAMAKQGYVRWLEGPNAAAPVERGLLRHLLLGLFVGLAGGIALAYLVDRIDDRIRSPLDAEGELGPGLLGILMSVPGQGSDAHATELMRAECVLRNPRSMIAEQCHNLTTQIYSLFLDAPPRALMVVSPAGEDGKTLVATSLAMAVAARGKRVLLIDADLRCGRMHELFGVPVEGGLYEMVTHQVTLEQAVHKTASPNVDVITCGALPEKVPPVRIFEHRELAALVEQMKAHYDLVLFDTPPIPLVSEALLLTRLVDGALAVARAGKTTRPLARKLVHMLAHAQANLLGWVLNDLPLEELSNKYYYRYGYGRQDGYGRMVPSAPATASGPSPTSGPTGNAPPSV